MGSLFIGLGGFGIQTLDRLSEKMDAYNKDLANHTPDTDGKYPCNVSVAMEKIAEEGIE